MNLARNVRVIGRYLIAGPIASGGMAVVHLGRFLGPEGFSRTVAVKQLHAHYASDPDFVQMFLDEARLAARVRHPNVISPLDIVPLRGELFLVLEYVHGETLLQLSRLAAGATPPLRVITSIMSQTLLGLHAAHEAHDEQGRALDIVHRDVSPPNILVGEDGVARVLDFGIAKATHRAHQTAQGQLKGKLGYMSPEQLRLEPLDRRSDVFAAGVVLWELCTGQALFATDDPALAVRRILSFEPTPPSLLNPSVTPELDAVVLRALAPHREQRFESARAMAVALEAAVPPASTLEVAVWVERVAGDSLRRRANCVADLESVTLEPSVASEAPLGVTRTKGRSAAAPALVSAADVPAPHAVEEPPALAGAPAAAEVLVRRSRARLRLTAIAAALLASVLGGAALKARSQHGDVFAVSQDPRVELMRAKHSAATPRAPAPEAVSSAPAVEAAPAPALTAPTVSPDAATVSPDAVARRLARSSKQRASSPSCEVPYTIDEQGVKRFRAECFEASPSSR